MKTKKTLIVTFMAVVFCLSMILTVFAACNTPKEPEQENGITDNGGMSMDEDITGNGIELMSTIIPRVRYAANNISPQAESAYTLTATITPAGATYTDLEWSIAFVNLSSAWANGKNVADYVTLDANGLQATLSCLQAFGEKIVVKATSLDNPNASATCTLDYRKRVTSATVSLQPSSGNAITLGTNANSVSATVLAGTSYTVKVNVTEGVGTIASGYKVTHSYGAFVDNFFSAINTSGTEMSTNERWTMFNSGHVVNSLNLDRSEIMSWLMISDWACDNGYEEDYTDRVISRMFATGTSKNLGRWRLRLVNANNAQILDTTFYFAINVNAVRTAVTGVSFGNTNLIFE